MSNHIIERIKQEIANARDEAKTSEVGVVTAVGDGIVEIDGLADAQMMEMVAFDTGEGKTLSELLTNETVVYGIILNLEEDAVKAVLLNGTTNVTEGARVFRTQKLLSVPAGDDIVGKVITPLGEVVDGTSGYTQSENMPIERTAYGVMDRASVDTPLHTGIKAIDSMIPIGRGQRELIIGDRQTGKTTLAIDTIINQRNEPEESRPICIYVAVGQKRSKTAQLRARLEAAGALHFTTIVAASAAEPSPLLFIAPFAGVAIAEYFMKQGKDVLIVFDDLSKHANAYRQMSLLLRRPPGREAYPGDIFYLHSRLLERSAKLNDSHGGGSITALPIIETQEGDVSAYIPTNVISITDGQIFLETDLFNKGIRPALNVGISVSRVGSSAQTKAMKKVAGKIRLELAQFRELEAFMQFASDLDEETKSRIERGQKYVELLKQGQNEPIPFYEIVATFYAANNGILDGATVEYTRDIEAAYIEFLKRDRPNILTSIEKEKALSDELVEKLEKSIIDFKEAHHNFYE